MIVTSLDAFRHFLQIAGISYREEEGKSLIKLTLFRWNILMYFEPSGKYDGWEAKI